MLVTIADKQNSKYYCADLSNRQVRKFDNGALVSCGLTVGESITASDLATLNLEEISYETWKHSSCQSACTARGNFECRW